MKNWVKKICFVLLACMLIVGVALSYKQQGEEHTKNALLMDTVITLKATGKNAKPALDESIAYLKKLDVMANATNAKSDVTSINTAAGEHAVKVHKDIIQMILTANDYAKQTDGAFDITVGPLVDLWGIGTDNERIPSDGEIKAALDLVGYQKVTVDEKADTVYLTQKGMQIDLGGVAKGFAADKLIAIYKKYNIKDGLISLGSSSVYAVGKNEEGSKWTVGIVNPRDEKSDNYLGVLQLSDEMISTSGDYERYFIKDGKRYFHILDPKTGYPADSGAISTTIVIDKKVKNKGVLSDILSTAVFVMGQEKGIAFMEKINGVSGEVTTSDKTIHVTKNFDSRLSEINSAYHVK